MCEWVCMCCIDSTSAGTCNLQSNILQQSDVFVIAVDANALMSAYMSMLIPILGDEPLLKSRLR